MTVRADWRLLAACIGQPELFYTDKYLVEAQRICNGCPVSRDCKMARRELERVTKSAHPRVWAGELWITRNNVTHSSRARRP